MKPLPASIRPNAIRLVPGRSTDAASPTFGPALTLSARAWRLRPLVAGKSAMCGCSAARSWLASALGSDAAGVAAVELVAAACLVPPHPAASTSDAKRPAQEIPAGMSVRLLRRVVVTPDNTQRRGPQLDSCLTPPVRRTARAHSGGPDRLRPAFSAYPARRRRGAAHGRPARESFV